MSHISQYVLAAAHERDEVERHADHMAETIRTFIKGKRGPELRDLRAVLAEYDREVRKRPVLDPPPEELQPAPEDRWQ